MVLLGALGAFLGAFVLLGLPRLHHPLFDAERFHLASDDRFFVSVLLEGARESELTATLGRIGALSVQRVGGELLE